MSLNRFMHDENVFKKPPDFKDLALRYPEFRKHVRQDISGKVLLDFKNPDSLRTLSQILLLDKFGLSVTIPSTCLIPTIPSRLNYLLWIKDLLKCLPEDKEICGLDIGTGASSVYCLLAAKHLNWNMTGTEVDAENFAVAAKNVTENNLKDKITIVPVSSSQILDPATWPPGSNFQFTICNPPFFIRDEERNMEIDEIYDQPPIGKDCEIKTQGGEVKFIKMMADQSVLVKDKVCIFTTLCGHKSSVVPIKQYLTSLGVASQTNTEFCQGKTMRWGVAWTWSQIDLNTVKSLKYMKSKEKAFSWSIPQKGTTALNLFQQIKTWLQLIKVDLTIKRESKHLCSARLTSNETQWRKQRKQRRQKLLEKSADVDNKVEETKEGKLTERNDESSNDTNNTAESRLIEELLNSNGNNLVNSTEVGHSKMKQEQNESHGCQNGTNNQEEDIGVNDHQENTTENDKANDEVQIEANINLRLAGPVILLEISYLGGQAGRDGVHQILQYIKNRHVSLNKK